MLNEKKLLHYELLLSRIRRKLFDYDNKQYDKAVNVMNKIKAKCSENWRNRYNRKTEKIMNVYYL